MHIRYSHRFGAIVLGLFIFTHLAVHMTAIFGSDVHAENLDFVQKSYRPIFLEIILVAVIMIQIISGIRRLRFQVKERWAQLQVFSGCYILFFLVMHTSAALYTHHVYGIETDFFWVAGSLQYSPIKYGFAVYYFLAVFSIFTHWAAAIHFAVPSAYPFIKRTLPMIGAALGIFIIAVFAGAFYSIEIPAPTAEYYNSNFGWIGVTP